MRWEPFSQAESSCDDVLVPKLRSTATHVMTHSRDSLQQQDGCRFPSPHKSTLLSHEGFQQVPQTLLHQRVHTQTTSGSQTAPPGHDYGTTDVRWLAGISDLW